jgi:GAF domain-containing protein
VTVGVLQVLDKHTSPTFSLRDMELLAVFARQAAAGIEATRLSRDPGRFARTVLREAGEGEVTEADLDALVEATAIELGHDDGAPFWRLVDRVARLRTLSDADLDLVGEILDVVGRRRTRASRETWRPSAGTGRSGD